MDASRTRYRPAATGDLTADWAPAVGRPTEPYAARRIAGPGVSGQFLSLPGTFSSPPLDRRAGQEGYRWLTTPWPDRWATLAVGGFVAAAPALAEEWYVAAPLVSHPNPPVAPSAGDRVWRVSVGATEVGFLVRSSGLLRWEVRSRFVVDGYLPDEVLLFEDHPWPLPVDGSWYGAACARVP